MYRLTPNEGGLFRETFISSVIHGMSTDFNIHLMYYTLNAFKNQFFTENSSTVLKTYRFGLKTV